MSGKGKERFRGPRLAINRVYTRKGDQGSTTLVGGQPVDKNDLRIAAYGTVDELQAALGVARHSVQEDDQALAGLALSLLRVQHELFNLGSILATLEEDQRPEQPRVTEAEIRTLEDEIDRCNADLEPLRSFVLPGGCRLNAELHLARTICRRAERVVVGLSRQGASVDLEIAYLNRLSDALFVWSRWASRRLGVDEVLWDPNASASGRDEASE